MKEREACANYFKQQKEWNRCFLLLRKKWESLGHTGGKIRLAHCQVDERSALERFLGRKLWEEDVEVTLQEFEEALQSTRFRGITLEELLEAYFDCSLVSNQDKRAEKEKRKQDFYEQQLYAFREKGIPYSAAAKWLEQAWNTKSFGFYLLTKELEKNSQAAEVLLQNVGKALASVMEEGGIPLAVLAAEISGNPHYLDRGTTAGTLFLHGLCCMQDRSWPESAYEWKERLLEANIIPDDISSQVTAYGIHLECEDGLHTGVEAFGKRQEPVVLTGFHMKRVKGAYAEHKKVFIVENEMVFGYLLEQVRGIGISMLCTSGQLRTVALELIQLLAREGMELYYSGDLDPEGMGIADRLWQKYPEQIHIWRMSPSDYERARSQEPLSARSLTMLANLTHPQLQQTAELVQREKLAGYQENLLQELLEDLKKH